MASQPPRKSYFALSTPLRRLWYQIPIGAKYASAMATCGYTVAHIHPDTLVTIGPPFVLGGWYLYGRWRKSLAEKNRNKVTSHDGIILICKYDESLLENVLVGVENEFDHFVEEVIKIADARIKDFLFQKSADQPLQYLLDENQQVSVHLSKDLDLFVVGEDGSFIKLAMPMFSSSLVELRKRVGTTEVYLVRQPTDDDVKNDAYRCRIEVVPFKQLILKSDVIVIETKE